MLLGISMNLLFGVCQILNGMGGLGVLVSGGGGGSVELSGVVFRQTEWF